MNRLEEQILECFPAGNYGMVGMLRLMEIVESDKIPSAAIECKLQPRLLINPNFVREHADSPEKLLMLVMHELHHVLLGHTTLFPTISATQNFIFDCIINSLLSRMFPSRIYTSFFTDFYSDERFPECFLRPPRDWDGTRVDQLPEGLKECKKWHRRTVAELYRALYSETGVSYDEIYKGFRFFKGEDLPATLLIGAHPESAQTGPMVDCRSGDNGTGGPLVIDSTNPDLQGEAPVLLDLVRGIVEKWPQPPDPIKGRSFSDVLQQSTLNLAGDISPSAKLRNLLKWLGNDISTGTIRDLDELPINCFSSVPGFARRDLIMQSLGHRPLLFINSLVQRQRVPVGERVHVYVDVSGSMGGILEAVYKAVILCSEFVHQQVHLFSNDVVDVTLRQFKSGERNTSYGTDVECVANHIKQNKIKRACLVTDGYVGDTAGEQKRTLESTKLGVALTGDEFETTCQDLEDVSDRVIQLEV